MIPTLSVSAAEFTRVQLDPVVVMARSHAQRCERPGSSLTIAPGSVASPAAERDGSEVSRLEPVARGGHR